MMVLKRVTLSVLALLPVTAGCADRSAPVPREENLDALLAEQATAFLATQPTYATLLDVPEEMAGGPYSHRLPDYSPEGMEEVRSLMAGFAAELHSLGREEGDPSRALDIGIVHRVDAYYAGVEGVPYGYIDEYFGHLPYVVNQISGPVIDVPKRMQSHQTVESLADAAAYVERLVAFGPMIEGVIAKLRADAEFGVVPPRAILESTLAYVDGFTAVPAAEHFLVVALGEKLDGIAEQVGDERERTLREAERAVETHVYPAYRALAKALRVLEQRASDNDGIWAQPEGALFYAAMVRMMGDSDKSPEEIHRIGLEEVARITAQMDAILKAQGYTEGGVGDRMTGLASETRFLYEDSDEGRAKLLADLNDEIEEIERRLPEYFSVIPPQAVEVRRVPVFSQDGEAAGFYTPPTLDGSKPGIYWINLRDMGNWPSFALKTLTVHEAVPGHHFQTALNLDREDLPFFRKTAPFNAYNEGWALYTEQLAWEMGLYDDDPFGDLGRLRDELFRAVRLVVDTGLHHERWTRQQAIDYMLETTGMHPSEIVPEIERYMVWPGQALGYKLGMLTILELRDEARAALGDGFDIREFHREVLRDGPVPMSVLRRKIERWIEDAR